MLEITDFVVADVELWKARADRARIEHLVRDSELRGGGDGVFVESFDMGEGGPFRARDHEAAVGGQQAGARLMLDLAPDFVSAHHQRRQMIALADRKPCDARVAMGGAVRVRRRVRVEREHARATLCELKGGGAAHRTQPEDNGVMTAHASNLPLLVGASAVDSAQRTQRFRKGCRGTGNATTAYPWRTLR